jgi:hypothetical protein
VQNKKTLMEEEPIEFTDVEFFKMASDAMTMTDEFALEEAHDGDEDNVNETVVQLANGSFHVCKGNSCPYVCESRDAERHLICTLSGQIVCAYVEASASSAWTGRSVGSADPDMVSAIPKWAWKGKRDAFGDSKHAYAMAKNMTLEDVQQHINASTSFGKCGKRATKGANAELKPKRGAPCVSEVDQKVINKQKRDKAAKRAADLDNARLSERAVQDAASIVQKIFQQNANGDASGSQNNKMPADPRLENYDFVFRLGLKRYLKKCTDEKLQPSLNEIHDVAIAASNFARTRRHESKRVRELSKGRMLVLNSRTVQLCATLIISIWSIVVRTTHFKEHTASDSFRPFAAGILYAFKRGIRMKDNTVVVPAIPEIANQLPTLRSASATSTARQLQASSHRGLCAVHKSISSIDFLEGDELVHMMQRVKTASGIAHSLRVYVESYMKSPDDPRAKRPSKA